MPEVVKSIPSELDADSYYAVRVRTINAFGVASQWSESLVVDTNTGFRRLVWTDNGPVYYFENGKVLFSLYEASGERTNYIKNPSFQNGTTGWTRIGTTGQVNLTTTTTSLFDSSAAYIKKLVSTNPLEVGLIQTSAHYTATVPGEDWAAGVYMRNVTNAQTAYISLNWYRSNLTLISKTTAGLSPAKDKWSRINVYGTAPALTAFVGVSMYLAGSAAINREVRFDGVMLQRGYTFGSYFDGSTSPTAVWAGTPHDSISTIDATASTITINKDVIIGGSYDGTLNIYREDGTSSNFYMDSETNSWGSRFGATFTLHDSAGSGVFSVNPESSSAVWNGILYFTEGPSDHKISLRGTSAANTPYLSFYNNTGTTRYGYVQGTSTNLNIVSDTGDVSINSGGGQVRTSDGIWTANAASRFYTTSIIFGGSNSAYLQFYGGASSADSLGTRDGYIGFPSSTSMLVTCDAGVLRLHTTAAQSIDFYTSNAYQGRITSGGDFLMAKTAVDTTSFGCALTGSGRLYTTTGNATTFNVITNIAAAQDNDIHCHFRRSDVTVGSINMTAALTGVDYSTSSDMRLKGGNVEIDDEEALELLEKLHPLKYQWKYDENGDPDPDGTPKGPHEIGFLAQELFEVYPRMVTPGRGEWSQHKKYAAAKAKHSKAARALEAWKNDEGNPKRRSAPPALPEDPGQISPYEPWMSDNSKIVPTLTAAMQAMLRQIKELKEEKDKDRKEIAWLRELIEKK